MVSLGLGLGSCAKWKPFCSPFSSSLLAGLSSLASWCSRGFRNTCDMSNTKPQLRNAPTRRMACRESPPTWKKLMSALMVDIPIPSILDQSSLRCFSAVVLTSSFSLSGSTRRLVRSSILGALPIFLRARLSVFPDGVRGICPSSLYEVGTMYDGKTCRSCFSTLINADVTPYKLASASVNSAFELDRDLQIIPVSS